MLRPRGRASWQPSGLGRRPSGLGRRPGTAALAACALAAMMGVCGCAAAKAAGQTAPIQATNPYVPLPVSPGTTYAYLAIRNYTNSPDRLMSARTSVGGRVAFREPAGGSGQMRTVPSLTIPANSVLRLVPDGPHLLITGAGRMQNGKAITLTLVFSHGGSLSVSAVVTNPQDTQGSNYSMN
jgi:copper(I)-binding protein